MNDKQKDELRSLIIDLVRLDTQITKAENFERGHKTLSKQFDSKATKIANMLDVDAQKFIDDLDL